MYQDFRRKFKDFQIFTPNEIKKVFPDFDTKNLVNWQKKGYILKLRNGFYTFTDYEFEEENLYYFANRIYTPSYLSMETALSKYGIIPEGVYTIQSISTLKTHTFNTPLGKFTYNSIKKDYFFGYKMIQFSKFSYKIASMEKAILDILYFKDDIKDIEDIAALRWNIQVLKSLNFDVLTDYLSQFDSVRLGQKIKLLQKYINA